MLTLNVNDTRDRIRVLADIETADESKSVVRDATIIGWMNDAYRRVYNLAATKAPDLLTKSATLSSPYTYPSDFMRVRGFDYAPNGVARPLDVSPFPDRGNAQWSTTFPPWRQTSSGFVFPSGLTADVTIWYIPVPATLAAAGTYEAYTGWDWYLTLCGTKYALLKREMDARDIMQMERDEWDRLSDELSRMGTPPGATTDVDTLPDHFYSEG